MPNPRFRFWPVLLAIVLAIPGAGAQVRYQLLLKGGHVIDPRNQLDAVMDVAVADGKIAAVRAGIEPAEARTVVDVSGLYVTPGLIDAHVHLFATTGVRDAWAGDNSVLPDAFSEMTFKAGRVVWDWNARIGTDYRTMSQDYGTRDVDRIILPPKK